MTTTSHLVPEREQGSPLRGLPRRSRGRNRVSGEPDEGATRKAAERLSSANEADFGYLLNVWEFALDRSDDKKARAAATVLRELLAVRRVLPEELKVLSTVARGFVQPPGIAAEIQQSAGRVQASLRALSKPPLQLARVSKAGQPGDQRCWLLTNTGAKLVVALWRAYLAVLTDGPYELLRPALDAACDDEQARQQATKALIVAEWYGKRAFPILARLSAAAQEHEMAEIPASDVFVLDHSFSSLFTAIALEARTLLPRVSGPTPGESKPQSS